MNGSVSKTEKEVESRVTVQPPPSLEKPYNSSTRKKKKKKQKHNSKEAGPTNTVVVTSDPTSTTNIPDYTRFVSMKRHILTKSTSWHT